MQVRFIKPLQKSILILVSFLFINTAAEADMVFPRGCEVSGFGFMDNYLVLNETGEQAFYLIQNRSDKKIELERQETQDAFMNPQLQSKLDPLNWSAFASDIANLHFKCFSYSGLDRERQLINCRDALEVCQYPRVKFALSNMGNYWISTNKAQNQVIKDATAKGIYLRW